MLPGSGAICVWRAELKFHWHFNRQRKSKNFVGQSEVREREVPIEEITMNFFFV